MSEPRPKARRRAAEATRDSSYEPAGVFVASPGRMGNHSARREEGRATTGDQVNVVCNVPLAQLVAERYGKVWWPRRDQGRSARTDQTFEVGRIN